MEEKKRVIYGAGGVSVCIFLWRIIFGIRNMFMGLSEVMANYDFFFFFALSSAIVTFTISCFF